MTRTTTVPRMSHEVARRGQAQRLLIEPNSLLAWIELKSGKVDIDQAAAHAKESADEQLYNYVKESRTASDFRSRAVVIGSTAIIPVHNAIEYRPSIWSDYGFESSGMAIRNDFNALVADPEVSKIVFDIDSPGGVYTGTPELAKDIYDARGKKEIVAISNPFTASGALWIGSAAEKFYCLGSGMVGSIGCLMLHSDWSQFYSSMGITNTVLRSPEGKADFNSIEPLSEEAKAFYQQQVEDIANEFQAAVAKHRGISSAGTKSAVRVVQDTMGGGRMMTPDAAVRSGLIDGIVGSLDDVIGRKVKSTKRVKLSPRLEIARLSGLRAKDASQAAP